jgi:type IV pilus assembly protein PilE
MKSNAGVTLIELMITVAVVAVLAAIAYPSYRDQVLRSHRTDGKAALMQASQTLERCFTRTNAFNAVSCTALVPLSTTIAGGRYQITSATAATTYTLSAVPQGPQAADTRCGTLTLTQDGTKTKSGPGTLAECW